MNTTATTPPALNQLLLENPVVDEQLYAALLKEASQFLDTYDLCPPEELPLKEFCLLLAQRISEYRRSKPSSHFDSFPRIMKENATFNCVGASLLSLAALQRKEVTAHLGVCFEHVVVILEHDDELYWLDAGNNTFQKIKVREQRSYNTVNHPLLYLENRIDNFGAVVMLPASEIIGSMLENLIFVQTIVDGKAWFPINDYEHARAQAFFDTHVELYSSASLKTTHSEHFSHMSGIAELPEILEDKQLVPSLRSLDY